MMICLTNQNPDPSKNRSIFGTSPLHLSVDWPWKRHMQNQPTLKLAGEKINKRMYGLSLGWSIAHAT